LFRNGEFRAISLVNSIPPSSRRRGEVFLRFKSDKPSLDVKLSPCGRFVAIQRSDFEVQVLSAEKASEQHTIECPGKANAVLRGGVIWVRPREEEEDAPAR
jgi:hypothetical protein